MRCKTTHWIPENQIEQRITKVPCFYQLYNYFSICHCCTESLVLCIAYKWLLTAVSRDHSKSIASLSAYKNTTVLIRMLLDEELFSYFRYSNTARTFKTCKLLDGVLRPSEKQLFATEKQFLVLTSICSCRDIKYGLLRSIANLFVVQFNGNCFHFRHTYNLVSLMKLFHTIISSEGPRRYQPHYLNIPHRRMVNILESASRRGKPPILGTCRSSYITNPLDCGNLNLNYPFRLSIRSLPVSIVLHHAY